MKHRTLGWLCTLACALPALSGTMELVSTNASWRYFKGSREPSTPDPATWRLASFPETAWSTGNAPFSYGEAAITTGTKLTDMPNAYSSLFLRRSFTLASPGQVATLDLDAVCDDGFIAWLNGREVARHSAPAGDPRFDSLASANATEPVAFLPFAIAVPEQVLVAGTNVLAVQVFNVSLGSSDLVFDAALTATMRDDGPPSITAVVPPPGLATTLDQISVTFSEPVRGVTAEHFLINDLPASGVSGTGNQYTFTFPSPVYGTVQIRWSTFHTIEDFESPARRFDLAAAGSTWTYELLDPKGPAVTVRQPPPGLMVPALSRVELSFDKAVDGVDAADLLVNGVQATNVTGVGAGPYRFEFAAAPVGLATISWAAGHGIASSAAEPHLFNGGTWTYTVDPQTPIPALEITEFMAENYTAYRDEDKDPEDWIEIYNEGSTAANLEGWSLSNDPEDPGRWVFPAVSLPPGSYLVVFASGKDRAATTAGARLHTNFKLNPTGGYLGLFPPFLPRTPVSEVSYAEQGPDYAYGRENGFGAWKYFAGGTPGSRNPLSRITSAVDQVHFSVPRGFFTRPFNLTLHCPTPGATIIYTTNSSVPMLTNGFVYSGPITISGTRIVRAAAYRTNALPSAVQTHSYLVNVAATRLRLPSLSLVTSSNNLYGRTGIMEPPNPRNRGAAWERPVSIEWIRSEDNGGFQADGGIRVQGGDYVRGQYNYRSGSLPFNKYSFRLYFRGEYGRGRLNEALFPDTTQTSFDTISLRAGMNDHTNPYLTDEMVRGLARDVGQPSPVGTFVNVYLNGVFKGYYNPCERIDEDFLRMYHGGGDDWDIIAQMGEVQEGNTAAWTALKNFANTRNLTNQTEYLALARQLDLTNFVDYLCPLIYVDNDDWPHNNWRVARERAPGGLFRFYVWDAEWAFGVVNGHAPSFNTIANQLSSTSPPWGSSEIQQLFNKLKRIPEFKLLFADRVHQHFFNDGALTDERIKLRYQIIKNRLNGSVSGFNDRIGTTWIPQRRRYVLDHFRAAGFLASSNAPGFNIPGGHVPTGFALQLTNLTGAIYYTTTGTDPRVMFSGAVAPEALAYDPARPVRLDRDLEVCARSLAGTNWSALTRARFQVERLGWPVRITEIMYNPPGGEAFEFLELSHVGGVTVDLSGWSFEGIEFRFPEPSALLEPGQRLVLASDEEPAAFAARYPTVAVAGWFAGALANGGERIALLDRSGRLVTAVTYGDGGAWPHEADGDGYSLELVNSSGSPDAPANWRRSGSLTGSPGRQNAALLLPQVRINEVYAAGASGAEPVGGDDFDWVELFNPGEASVSLSGWGLQGDGSARFLFPSGTILAPQAYVRVWCDQRTNAVGYHAGFGLKQSGETLLLTDASSHRVDAITFGLQAAGYTIARVGASGAWALADPTPGAPNEPAALAPSNRAVINEFLANAPAGADDWIELYNTDANRPLALQGLWLATSNALEQITSLSFLAPSGFGVFKADGQAGPDHLAFKLPAAGDTLILHDITTAELQRLNYRNAAEGVASGLLPDGTGSLTGFPNSASPGASNYIANNTTLRLNELMAASRSYRLPGQTQACDWIELVNLGTTAAPLAGHSLSRGRAEAGEWVFPPGTVLPAGGFLVVTFDSSRPASTVAGPSLNVGDDLEDRGDRVHWFDAKGQLLDAIEFGFALPDQTSGRTSGETLKLLSAPTPGQANSLPLLTGDPGLVRLNEWMPGGEGDDWVEAFNPQQLPVDLAGFRLSDDPSLAGQTNHILPALTLVAPGGWACWKADGETSKGPEHLRFSLDALGETLRLYSPAGTLVDSVDILPTAPNTSTGRYPDGQAALFVFAGTVSPGTANFRLLPGVVINEILSHTDPPLEDAIELHNLGTSAEDLSGWYLSDSIENWRKYRIADGTVLPAGGYLVFYENQFNASALGASAFNLNSAHGGEVWLSKAYPTGEFLGQRVGLSYGATRNGVSLGRFMTSRGPDFVPTRERSFGADAASSIAEFRTGTGLPNAYPRVGPVVITEIHYHPLSGAGSGAIEAPGEEYLELENLSTQAVPLYDPVHPTNTWRLRGGVEFDFPDGATLPPGAFALIVAFDPVKDAASRGAFVAKYGVPAATLLFGPLAGRLANEGEAVDLLQPDNPQSQSHPDAGFVPYTLAERIQYGTVPPWPLAMASTGLSLQREEPAAYGNEPLNWRAARPSAGRSTPARGDDGDGDGLPDDWEIVQGLDPASARGDDGASGDPDQDGLSNLREFQTGNSPQDFSLVILGAHFQGGQLRLTFNAAASRSYRLELRRDTVDGVWETLTNVLPSTTGELEFSIGLPPGLNAGFLRLVLP